MRSRRTRLAAAALVAGLAAWGLLQDTVSPRGPVANHAFPDSRLAFAEDQADAAYRLRLGGRSASVAAIAKDDRVLDRAAVPWVQVTVRRHALG
ncbi:MAG: hypothetical protein JWO90_401 [Solirubrobacterales bacterium]|jgi:hypothetical protein|nr:hypothetical protein [Solirubrobacterales bacterium]